MPPITTIPRLRQLALLAALVALAVPVAALAGTSADVTATATISPGALLLSSAAAPAFGVTLDGSDKTPTYTIPFAVSDPRGTGAGWNVTVTSTTFSDGTHSLATDASAVTAVATSCAVGTTCANASDGVALPVAVPAATTAPAAVQMLDAATDTGMGDLDATATVQVSIPAGSFAGTYTSTVSLAVASGP